MESNSSTEPTLNRGFLLSGRDWRIVGLATWLVALNAAMMYLFAMTPLAIVNQYLFAIPIIGMVVYGGGLMLGEAVARSGVTNTNPALAVVGVAILEFTYGTFGAGILTYAPQRFHLPAITITGVVTAALTLLVGIYIYARNKDFDHWGTYSIFMFIAALATGLLGSFFTPLLILTFVLVILGFMFRLGYEIWKMKASPNDSVTLHAIGIYVAVMGVFVHILQIVIRVLARE